MGKGIKVGKGGIRTDTYPDKKPQKPTDVKVPDIKKGKLGGTTIPFKKVDDNKNA